MIDNVNKSYNEDWLKMEGLVWHGKSLPYNYKLKERARKLRNNQTVEERKLWYDFLSEHSSKFLRQRVIGHYIVDFYCAKLRMIRKEGSFIVI